MENMWSFIYTHTPLVYLVQSLWRDEAFSVLIAKSSPLEIIRITAADFNPPLYYLLLHSWMRLFGDSEISIRLLSLLFFVLFLGVFYFFARRLLSKHSAYLALAIAAVNPMLIYYGLEARMYSLYYLLVLCSMFFFYIKKPALYVFFTTLALYTHPYTIFTPLIQGLYLLVGKKLTREWLVYLILPFIFYLPWIMVIMEQLQRTGEMWMYPINFTLVGAVLGNLYTGYEGTPGHLWPYMKAGSLVIIAIVTGGWIYSSQKKEEFMLFSLWACFPLAVILGISIVKPVYVNRYIISTTVAEIMLLSLSIGLIRHKRLKKLLGILVLGVSIFLLYYFPGYIKKTDIRSTFADIKSRANEGDLVYATSPLVYFESVYYFGDESRVFLYNPDMVKLPGYLGNILMPESKYRAVFPPLNGQVFLVNDDASFSILNQAVLN